MLVYALLYQVRDKTTSNGGKGAVAQETEAEDENRPNVRTSSTAAGTIATNRTTQHSGVGCYRVNSVMSMQQVLPPLLAKAIGRTHDGPRINRCRFYAAVARRAVLACVVQRQTTQVGGVGRTQQGGRLPSPAAKRDTCRPHIATEQVDSTRGKAGEGANGEWALKVAPRDTTGAVSVVRRRPIIKVCCGAIKTRTTS